MRYRRLMFLFAATVCTSCTTVKSQVPTREVHEQELRSSELPALRIRVDSAFTFLGTIPFVIGDFADGQRFVFIDADGVVVRRMIIAQFESIFPEADQTYNYSFDGTPVVAGYSWRRNPFAFSNREAAADNPQGEAALTATFLGDRGFQFADEMMLVRHLTVPDSARKHELILFYMEPVENAGVRLADLYEDGNETELFDSLAVELGVRADAAFEILPLQE